MHELSLAMDIVQILEAHEQELARITLVTLDIGTLSCVEPQALLTALNTAFKGTLAEGADVVTHTIEAQARCGDCQAIYAPPTRLDPCPHCGSFRKNWLAGQELRVKNIEGVARTAESA